MGGHIGPSARKANRHITMSRNERDGLGLDSWRKTPQSLVLQICFSAEPPCHTTLGVTMHIIVDGSCAVHNLCNWTMQSCPQLSFVPVTRCSWVAYCTFIVILSLEQLSVPSQEKSFDQNRLKTQRPFFWPPLPWMTEWLAPRPSVSLCCTFPGSTMYLRDTRPEKQAHSVCTIARTNHSVL